MALRSPLSPNAISFCALLLNLIAAALLYERFFLIAIFVIAIGGLADAFDGIVARVQAKESRFGDFLRSTLSWWRSLRYDPNSCNTPVSWFVSCHRGGTVSSGRTDLSISGDLGRQA